MAMSTPAALREQSTSSRFAAVVAVCLLLVFGTYVLSSPSDDGETTENNFFNIWHHKSSTWSNKKACGSGDDLEAALCSAADANKTVILSVVNEAFAEEDGLLDLFLESLREGEGTSQLIRHVLLVATDLPAFRRCRSLGLVRCYHLPPVNGSDFSSEQLFMSDGFIRLMWQRIRLLGDVLRHGYSFVFTDLDVIWLRNPFAMMNYSAGEEDFLISSDNFNGRPLDLTNELNSGFFFVAPNNRTVALFDEWYGSWNGTAGLKEQDVLNLMKWGGAFGRLGVRTRVLDTVRFSCFCQDSKDGRQVTTVHANCCRTMRAKVDDLKAVLDVFKRLNGASNVTWPVHTACHRSWMPMPSEKTKN